MGVHGVRAMRRRHRPHQVTRQYFCVPLSASFSRPSICSRYVVVFPELQRKPGEAHEISHIFYICLYLPALSCQTPVYHRTEPRPYRSRIRPGRSISERRLTFRERYTIPPGTGKKKPVLSPMTPPPIMITFTSTPPYFLTLFQKTASGLFNPPLEGPIRRDSERFSRPWHRHHC